MEHSSWNWPLWHTSPYHADFPISNSRPEGWWWIRQLLLPAWYAKRMHVPLARFLLIYAFSGSIPPVTVPEHPSIHRQRVRGFEFCHSQSHHHISKTGILGRRGLGWITLLRGTMLFWFMMVLLRPGRRTKSGKGWRFVNRPECRPPVTAARITEKLAGKRETLRKTENGARENSVQKWRFMTVWGPDSWFWRGLVI